MLPVVPPIGHGVATLKCMVGPNGMSMIFSDPQNTVRWALNGLPWEFIVAAERMLDPECRFALHRFEIRPSGIFYAGALEVKEGGMLEIWFLSGASDTFRILVRATELENLIKGIKAYWTC